MTMRDDPTHRARLERRFALAAAILLAIAGAAHVLAAEDVPGDRLPGGALVYQGDALAAVMTVRGQANTDPDHPLFDAVRQALSLQPGELPPGMATVLPARPTSLPAWTPARCMEYAQLFEDAGARHGVDPALLLSVMIAESGCNRAPVGELGNAHNGLASSQFARGTAGWRDAIAREQGQSCRPNNSTAYGPMQITTQWHGTERDWCDPVVAVDYAAEKLARDARSRGWSGSIYAYNSGGQRTAEGDRYLYWVGGMWAEKDQPTSERLMEWCRAAPGLRPPDCLGGSS